MDHIDTHATLEQCHIESSAEESNAAETAKKHHKRVNKATRARNYRHAYMPIKYGQWLSRQIWLHCQLLIVVPTFTLLISSYVGALNAPDVEDMSNHVRVANHSHVLGKKGYLVWSDQCKIADLDAYNSDVIQHFKRKKYKPCSTRRPLSKIYFDETIQRYVLTILKPALKDYSIAGAFGCCYMNVERINDSRINLTTCHNFIRNVNLPHTTDSIIVKCFSENKEIYANAHAMIPERWKVREKLNKFALFDKQAAKQPLSVLMIGIDSISRVNLIRAMPKTAQYLYDNAWFELAGYNKVEDNTFPNIMALATGYNLSSIMRKCSPYRVDGLGKCDFIWKQFGQHGYVTAYGEDAILINTFNYLKKGFRQPPVDYYMRPFLAAVENEMSLHPDISSGLPDCIAFKHESEYVYEYALEFARRFRNDSYFGFFWTNTHSHSDISQTTSMDSYMRQYLKRLVKQGTMENSIVILFSDHGLRFGPTRTTWSGHMEERLPFIFIWLPAHLRQAHPELVNALRLNRNRLTNPYDLHMTLKHILVLSGRVPSAIHLGTAPDCPHCQSLLQPVSPNRSCADIGIEEHWCTCRLYDKIYWDSKIVHSLAKRVVQHINSYVANYQNGKYAKMCQQLSLYGVHSAYRARPNAGDAEHVYVFRLTFFTMPNKAIYEATVQHHEITEAMNVAGAVSRLNMYDEDADGMGDFSIKKYCFYRREAAK